MPVKSRFRQSPEFIALLLRFRAEATEKRRKSCCEYKMKRSGSGYSATFIRAIGSAYRESKPIVKGRSTVVSLLKNQENSGNCFLLVRFSLIHIVAYRAWEIEWRTQITFQHILGDTARKHRRDERKRARDSFCETRAIARRRQYSGSILCVRVVLYARDRHVSRENRAGVILRNVLVSDIGRTINNMRFIDFAIAT